MNLYGYVGGDPVNFVDPSGTSRLEQGDIVCFKIDIPKRPELPPSGPQIDCREIGSDNDFKFGSVWLDFDALPGGTSRGDDLTGGGIWGGSLSNAQVRPLPPSTLYARPPVSPALPRPSVPYPRSASEPPGPGWVWRGGERGQWFNPQTGESLRPDLNHPPGIRPHWDYSPGRGMGGREGYRWFDDGTPQGLIVPKSLLLST